MKVYILYVLVISISITLASCDRGNVIVSLEDSSLVVTDSIHTYEGKLFDGTILSDPVDSKLTAQYQVRKGQYHGSYKEWYAKAQLKTDKHFKKGIEHGVQKGYHHNGNLSYEYRCSDGLRNGTYVEYFPSGKLQIQRQYENGSEVKNKVLDFDGKVLAHYVIRDGNYYGQLGSSNCISVINEQE